MEAATATREREAPRAEGGGGRRIGRRALDWLLNAYAGLALLYLLVPISVILVFSFNDPRGRFNFIWQEFSLDAWSDPFSVPGIGDALVNSLEIAAISTVIATMIFLVTVAAMIITIWQQRRAEKMAAVRPDEVELVPSRALA